MKNLKMSLSAFAVLAIVGSALAFKAKPFSFGNVWCFTSTPANQLLPCTGQANGTREKIETVSTGGSTSNPCASGSNPFINTATACQTPASGQEYLPDPE
jgi:hypothetical protein